MSLRETRLTDVNPSAVNLAVVMDNRTSGRQLTITLASTFTAEPLLEPLRFLLDALSLCAEVVLAPYDQILQELLHPGSVISQNSSGFNVLLVRPQDWIRERLGESTE